MKAIIPVAGMATRMRPHTHSNPKPLLQVAGKPAIDHILEAVEDLDISEVIFITGGILIGRMQKEFERHIAEKYSFKTRYIEQKELGGPAHALALAKPFIDEPVFIAYGDSLFETDMGIVKGLKDEAGIIWTKEVEDYKRFGICIVDKNGYLKEMVEKPDEPVGKLATIGIYFIRDYRLFFEALDYIFDNDLKVKGEFFLPDAFMYMVNKGAKIICPEVDAWHDTGKPETMLESNRNLLKKGHAKPHKEGDVEDSTIIPPVHIADGVEIRNSVVGPFVSIAKGAKITSCIIRDSLVGEDASLSNLVLERSIIGKAAVLSGESQALNVGDHSTISFSERKK